MKLSRIAWVTMLFTMATACHKAGNASDGGALDGGVDTSDGVNANDIQRYPDETKIDHETATLTQLATVRMSPPRGEPIVNIEAGTSVQKLASHADAFLVTFTNPKSGARTLGWIPQDAIGGTAPAVPAAAHHGREAAHDGGASAAPVADAGKHKTCAAGTLLASLPDGDECLKKCSVPADCPAKTICTAGKLVDSPGQTAKLCFKVGN